MFLVVTGEHLILGTRRLAIFCSIAVSVMVPGSFTLHFQPPYLQYWQIPCYTFAFCVLATNMNIFSTMFQSLFRAATLLNNCFKVRNKRNCMYEGTSLHFAWLYSLILNVFIYSLQNIAFSHHNLLTNVTN